MDHAGEAEELVGWCWYFGPRLFTFKWFISFGSVPFRQSYCFSLITAGVLKSLDLSET